MFNDRRPRRKSSRRPAPPAARPFVSGERLGGRIGALLWRSSSARAVATSSAAHALHPGRPDGRDGFSREEALDHCAKL